MPGARHLLSSQLKHSIEIVERHVVSLSKDHGRGSQKIRGSIATAEAIFSRLTMLRRAVRPSPMAEMVAIVTLDPQGGEVKLTVPAKFL